MALFGNNRIFSARGGPGVRARGGAHLVAWALIAMAAGLLGVSWIEPRFFDAVRGPVAGAVAPVVWAVSSLMEPVNRVVSKTVAAFTHLGEIDGLRAENARLTVLSARALELERENADLKRLTRFAGAVNVARFSARVMAASPSALARTLLIDAGRNQGVRDGFPVVGGEGLLGRVILAGEDTATVRLLSDRLSRVPVFIGKQQARGLLTGTGTGSPRLEFVAGDVPVLAGDVVTTSGLGGVFPRGLAVGVVVAEGAGWRVALTAADDAPFAVSVLQVEVPASDAGEAQNRKAERESAGSRLKAVVK